MDELEGVGTEMPPLPPQKDPEATPLPERTPTTEDFLGVAEPRESGGGEF